MKPEQDIQAITGAPMLATVSQIAKLEPGAVRQVTNVVSGAFMPAISRTVVLCASKNIPLTNAATAISRLVQQVSVQLCQSGSWPGATPIA